MIITASDRIAAFAAVIAAAEARTRPTEALSPEDQITNVMCSLIAMVNGPAHLHRMDAIRGTVDQLASMWQAYQAGELAPIPDDTLPF